MLKGHFCDILTDSWGYVRWCSGWRPNLVVQECDLLLAALMKRQPGMSGILYWAVGGGESAWDSAPLVPSPATSQLTRELARQSLAPGQLSYINGAGAPSAVPTNRLEITAEFHGDDLVSSGFLSLREFGLFGGDSTNEPDTGLMIDYVVHPRIDLSQGLILRRRVRLTFDNSAPSHVSPGAIAGFRASLPATAIDGVGEEYGDQLNAGGVVSIGDLVQVDPLAAFGDIPAVRLREFRAKARLVMGLRLDLSPFAALAQYSVSNVLLERPDTLAQIINAPGVTPGVVARLQEQLGVLQIALDEDQLQRVTISGLTQ